MPRPAAGELRDIADQRFDLTQFGRVTLWGILAALAALGAVLATRSEAGVQRIAAAMNGAPSAAASAPVTVGLGEPVAAPGASEARRLADTVSLLLADRDRLLARLEALERSLETTASIPPTPVNQAATPTPPASTAAMAASAPAVGEPAAVLPSAPDPGSPGGQGASNAQPSLEAGADATVIHTQFGLDLGAEASVEALRGLWSTVRAQHGPLLEGLRPLVRVRDNPQSGAAELRLVAGPLANAAAAARLCAVIGATGRACQPATFEGQRLALR